ncbi:MAG: YncE family protein [marine benthic group bacterium]|nr:YncE family protein [Gemmatimonadota bacterium]
MHRWHGRIGLAVAAAVGIAGLELQAQVPGLEGTLVVVNKGGANVSVVDVGSGVVLATLPTGDGPHEVALSPDGTTAVITDYGGRTPGRSLTVVHVPSLSVIGTIDLGAYERPHGIAFLPDSGRVLVTSESTGSVVVVDVNSGRVTGALPTSQRGSHMLALPGPAARVWTSNIRDGTVSEIDMASGTTSRIIPVAEQPEAIGVTPDGAEVWVGSNAAGTVSVVDAMDGSVATALEGFHWPYRVAFTPDGTRALIPDLRAEELRIVDRATRAELHRIDLSGGAPQGVIVTPDGTTAFQSLSARGEVLAIDLESGEIRGVLKAGQGPDGLAFTPLVGQSAPPTEE